MLNFSGHSFNRLQKMFFDYKDPFLKAIKHGLILLELIHSGFFHYRFFFQFLVDENIKYSIKSYCKDTKNDENFI
jgi:hypothetical protein